MLLLAHKLTFLFFIAKQRTTENLFLQANVRRTAMTFVLSHDLLWLLHSCNRDEFCFTFLLIFAKNYGICVSVVTALKEMLARAKCVRNMKSPFHHDVIKKAADAYSLPISQNPTGILCNFLFYCFAQKFNLYKLHSIFHDHLLLI